MFIYILKCFFIQEFIGLSTSSFVLLFVCSHFHLTVCSSNELLCLCFCFLSLLSLFVLLFVSSYVSSMRRSNVSLGLWWRLRKTSPFLSLSLSLSLSFFRSFFLSFTTFLSIRKPRNFEIKCSLQLRDGKFERLLKLSKNVFALQNDPHFESLIGLDFGAGFQMLNLLKKPAQKRERDR